MRKRSRVRRILLIICSVCIMLAGNSLNVLADMPVSGSYGDFTWEYDINTKTLTFEGNGELTIPNSYLDCIEAETIVIPSGCTSLSDSALRAFRNSEVTNYVVSENNDNYASVDGVLYTKDMETLIAYPANKTTASFAVPETVISIQENAFNGAEYLKNVTLPSGLEVIECNAFYNTGLTSVTIPASVYRIYNQAFAKCTSLTSIQVEKNEWGYGDYFAYDGVLYSKMSIYDADTQKSREICELECYPAGKSGASFTVPSGVTWIGMDAFQGASEIQTLKLPVTVTKVSGQAFAGASSLVHFYIPSSVTDIIGIGGMGEDCGIRDITNAVIYGKSGSLAQTYATANNVQFITTEDPAYVPPVEPFGPDNQNVTPEVPETTPSAPVLTKEIGQKALKLSASKLPLQVKKTTSALKVTEEAPGDSVVAWTSSKPSVVSVNKTTGKLTAKKIGKATITVTMKSGASLNCTVTVQKKAVKVKKLILSKTRVALKKGKSYTIKVTKNPLTSTEKITFKSSNKKIATVSSKGKVIAKKKGTVKITVKASGGATKTCKVTVK